MTTTRLLTATRLLLLAATASLLTSLAATIDWEDDVILVSSAAAAHFRLVFFFGFVLKLDFSIYIFYDLFDAFLLLRLPLFIQVRLPFLVVLLKRADRHAERSFRIINTSNNISETFYFVWEIISSFFLWLCKKNIREIRNSKFSGHFFLHTSTFFPSRMNYALYYNQNMFVSINKL